VWWEIRPPNRRLRFRWLLRTHLRPVIGCPPVSPSVSRSSSCSMAGVFF
jgi:hypothetical protein